MDQDVHMTVLRSFGWKGLGSAEPSDACLPRGCLILAVRARTTRSPESLVTRQWKPRFVLLHGILQLHRSNFSRRPRYSVSRLRACRRSGRNAYKCSCGITCGGFSRERPRRSSNFERAQRRLHGTDGLSGLGSGRGVNSARMVLAQRAVTPDAGYGGAGVKVDPLVPNHRGPGCEAGP